MLIHFQPSANLWWSLKETRLHLQLTCFCRYSNLLLCGHSFLIVTQGVPFSSKQAHLGLHSWEVISDGPVDSICPRTSPIQPQKCFNLFLLFSTQSILVLTIYFATSSFALPFIFLLLPALSFQKDNGWDFPSVSLFSSIYCEGDRLQGSLK